MTAEKWLNRAYKIDREIDALIEERQKSFDKACGISGGNIGAERVQTSKRNMTADWSIAYIEYTQRIESRMAELWEVKGEVFDAINQVEDNRLRQLLLCRYIKFMKWEEIAEKMIYEVRNIYKLRRKALKAVTKIIFGLKNGH